MHVAVPAEPRTARMRLPCREEYCETASGPHGRPANGLRLSGNPRLQYDSHPTGNWARLTAPSACYAALSYLNNSLEQDSRVSSRLNAGATPESGRTRGMTSASGPARITGMGHDFRDKLSTTMGCGADPRSALSLAKRDWRERIESLAGEAKAAVAINGDGGACWTSWARAEVADSPRKQNTAAVRIMASTSRIYGAA